MLEGLIPARPTIAIFSQVYYTGRTKFRARDSVRVVSGPTTRRGWTLVVVPTQPQNVDQPLTLTE